MISGFLYAYKKEWEQPFDRIFIKHIKKFMYPFLTFSIINLTWNVLYYQVVFPSAEPPYSMKKMFLYTVSTYGYNALWYLPCLLWGTLLFLAIRRAKRHDLIMIAFSIFVAVFFALFDKKLTKIGFISYVYCYLIRVAVATVFVYAGHVLFSVFKNMDRMRENILLLSCMVICAVIFWLYQAYPEHFPRPNPASHQFGNPYVMYLTPIAYAIVFLLVCKKFLRTNRVLSYFGRNSLILMALHMDVTIRIAWWIFPKLQIDLGETINSLIVIGMELIMFPFIIGIINRYFPFILKYTKKTAK